MTMHYKNWPQEEHTFDESSQYEILEEPTFDERVFTPKQIVELDILCKENPTLTRSDLATMILINMEPHAPNQVSSSMNTSMLIDDCYALIDLTEKLDTLRFEILTRQYHKVNLDIDYLHTLISHEDKLSVYEESSFLLEKLYLGDALNVDEILNEIDNPKVEIKSRGEDIVFYMVDGDEVDYFFMNSFESEVDFIFSPNAFDPHVHLTIKEKIKLYATLVVDVFAFRLAFLPQKTPCLFARLVFDLNRRRIKGGLAQPFDSHD